MSIYIPIRQSDSPPGSSKRSRPMDQQETAAAGIWSQVMTSVSHVNGSGSGVVPPHGRDWYSLLYNESNDRLLLLSATSAPKGCSGFLTKWKGTADSGFHVVQTVEPLTHVTAAAAAGGDQTGGKKQLNMGRASLMCKSVDGQVTCAFDNGESQVRAAGICSRVLLMNRISGVVRREAG